MALKMWVAKSELKCSLRESFGEHMAEWQKVLLFHAPALGLLQVQLPKIWSIWLHLQHLILITLILSYDFLPSQMAEFYSLAVWPYFKPPCSRAGCAAKIPQLSPFPAS